MGWHKDDDQDREKIHEEKDTKDPEESRLVCAKQSEGPPGGGGGKGGKKLKGCLRPPCKGKIINTSSGATAGGPYYPAPCAGGIPQLVLWAQLRPYLADPQMVLPFRAGQPAILVTEGWQAGAPVQIRLSGGEISWSQELIATPNGRLDFDLPLAGGETPPGRYTLEMNGLRSDGTSALRLTLEVVDQPVEPGEKPTREGPDVVRLDPDHLLVYGFLPERPFRLNVYTFDPARPWEGGAFLGSVEFIMDEEGHRVIDLDFDGQDASTFCFLAEGRAVVPVIVGLRGAGSLDFFEAENEAGCPDA